MFVLPLCLYKDLLFARISLMTWVHWVRRVYHDTLVSKTRVYINKNVDMLVIAHDAFLRSSPGTLKNQNIGKPKIAKSFGATTPKSLHVTAKIGQND